MYKNMLHNGFTLFFLMELTFLCHVVLVWDKFQKCGLFKYLHTFKIESVKQTDSDIYEATIAIFVTPKVLQFFQKNE